MGDGLWWLVLLLGVVLVSVLFLVVIGMFIWLCWCWVFLCLSGNVVVRGVDIVLLVGSESNIIWGFVVVLYDVFVCSGQKVYMVLMNEFLLSYCEVCCLFVLMVIYGDGEVFEGVCDFFGKLVQMMLVFGVVFVVFGFGDWQFFWFCGYVMQVYEVLLVKGIKLFWLVGMVDCQFELEFQQWCWWLGESLGIVLDICYKLMLLLMMMLKLVLCIDYGQSVDEFMVVLCFEVVLLVCCWWGWQRCLFFFEIGDFLGVLLFEGSLLCYYLLVSVVFDGFVEICVWC